MEVVFAADPPWIDMPPECGPQSPNKLARALVVVFSTIVKVGEIEYTCTFVFKTASSNSEATPTVLVEKYSLSKNPWSHILTEYCNISFTESNRPSWPRPVSGR